jgi:hypothetical protein
MGISFGAPDSEGRSLHLARGAIMYEQQVAWYINVGTILAAETAACNCLADNYDRTNPQNDQFGQGWNLLF